MEKTAVRSSSSSALMVGVLGVLGFAGLVDTAVCAVVESVSRAKALRAERSRLNVCLRRRWVTEVTLAGGEYTRALERYFLMTLRAGRERQSEQRVLAGAGLVGEKLLAPFLVRARVPTLTTRKG